MRNNLLRHSIFVAFALACCAGHAAVDVPVGMESQLQVKSNGGRVVAFLTAQPERAFFIKPPLYEEVASADSFFAVGKRSFIQTNQTWILIVTQTASRADRTAGACGSGTEDTLRLVQVNIARAQLVERSHLTLQSCLSSLSLNDDSGRSLQQILEPVRDPSRFQLIWLNHPRYGAAKKTLHVVDQRIRVD